jgi:hypothetical protein
LLSATIIGGATAAMGQAIPGTDVAAVQLTALDAPIRGVNVLKHQLHRGRERKSLTLEKVQGFYRASVIVWFQNEV